MGAVNKPGRILRSSEVKGMDMGAAHPAAGRSGGGPHCQYQRLFSLR